MRLHKNENVKRIMIFSIMVFYLLSIGAVEADILLSSTVLTNTTIDAVTDEILGEIKINVMNQGDEPPKDIQVIIVDWNGLRQTGMPKSALNINESFDESFILRNIELHGDYAFIVIIDYKDSIGNYYTISYPYSFIHNTSTESKVFADISRLEIIRGSETTLPLKLRNLDQNPKDLRIEIITPKEFDIDQNEMEVTMAGDETEELEFALSDKEALPDSSYAVFAIITYEEGDLFYSTIASVNVHVVEKPTTTLALIIIFVILLAIFIYFQLISSLRKRKSK